MPHPLSYKCPIPTPNYVWWTLMCQLVLVLLHSTQTLIIKSFCSNLETTGGIDRKYYDVTRQYIENNSLFEMSSATIQFLTIRSASFCLYRGWWDITWWTYNHPSVYKAYTYTETLYYVIVYTHGYLRLQTKHLQTVLFTMLASLQHTVQIYLPVTSLKVLPVYWTALNFSACNLWFLL